MTSIRSHCPTANGAMSNLAAAGKDFFAAALFAVVSGGVAGPSPGCFVSQAEVARVKTKRAVEDRVTSMVPKESTIADMRQEMFFHACFGDLGSSCVARVE